jgi:hypothetical protein
MVPTINVDTNIKEPTHGYLKVRESLYIRVIVWVNTILDYIGIRTILTKYEVCYMAYSPQSIANKQNILNIHTLLVSKQSNLAIDPNLSIYLSIYLYEWYQTNIDTYQLIGVTSMHP